MDQEKELTYLSHVEDVIAQNIHALEEHLSKSSADILDSKRELWQNFYDLDPEEIAATTQMIESDVILHDDNQRALHILRRQKETPYFGRIDFQTDGSVWICYIGLANLMDSDSTEILVQDWRAPSSSMYYNYELGPASFHAPAGEIKGEIVGKYQYKIVGGEMQYMFDSSLTIQDEILQKELSSNASDRMKNIIATIQKEQNQIIRSNGFKTLIVQGAAGSGKTSIALHRVAFLLYQYKESLKSNNILIISPSRIFSAYIAGVLPELGEESIVEMSMADIAEKELGPQFKLESRFDYMDHCLQGDESLSEEIVESIRFKASDKIVERMDDYITKRAAEIYVPQSFSIVAAEITESKLSELYYEQYARYAPLERIKLIRDFVRERISNLVGNKTVKNELRKQIEQELDTYQKYGSLLEEYNLFLADLNRQGYPAGDSVSGVVAFEDVFPLLLFKFKFAGKPDYRFVKHLLVDEMQDYTPVQYEILNMMFTCPKTILGDIDQTVDPYTNIGSNTVLTNLYGADSVYLELNTSYRSTYEIAETAKSILGEQKFCAVARHGDKPCLMECRDGTHQTQAIAEDIYALLEKGYASIALICKTKDEAVELWNQLKEHIDIRLLINPDDTYDSGKVITTCYVSKGLEFDCVIVPNCNSANFSAPNGRKPLYVAATRALHQLHFYCLAGQMTAYLQNAVQDGQIVC